MMHLNEQQQKAVLATDGRVLVLAGAGSGKTSVLICRIAHLINEKGVDPRAILGLTFTNKAAGEMQDRIGRFVPPEKAKQVNLSTFHSFCHSILRKEIHHLGYTREFTLYNENDMKRLIESLARSHLEHETADFPSMVKICEMIQEIKSGQRIPSGSPPEKLALALSHDLDTSLRAYNALDFDGLINLTIELFEKYPEILEKYQKRYRYLMIDEYQDTNHAQYQLAEMLSKGHNNLCVVGDDDQSIYGWRGSNVKNILNFNHNTLVKLEQNYRSTKPILACANEVITHNLERHEKNLWTTMESGEAIQLFHTPSEKEEAATVARRIAKMRADMGLKWSDFAILYRSNHLSRTFELALLETPWRDGETFKRGIPYRVIQGTELYERAEVKDLMAYLRFLANQKDQEALLRIINYPRRGISSKSLDILTKHNREEGVPLWDVLVSLDRNDFHTADLANQLTPTALKAITHFVTLIERAKGGLDTPSKAIHGLLQEIDFFNLVKLESKSEKGKQFKLENVQAVIEMLEEYEKTAEAPTLAEFVNNSLLDSHRSRFSTSTITDDRVNLLTLHSSKGLEFHTCFLVACEDHIIPHEKSIKETGIEEERRLFYVALTRAKRQLTLSMSRKRMRMGKEEPTTPSRFLHEIPKEMLKITDWRD